MKLKTRVFGEIDIDDERSSHLKMGSSVSRT